jgi:hypothetical protein
MDETTPQPNIQMREMQDIIASLQAQVSEIRDAYYRNNFSQQQIFNKYSDFTFRIKLPVVSALSSTCEAGEVCVYSGGLYLAIATNTWAQLGFV